MGVDIRALRAWLGDLKHADEVLIDKTERIVGFGCNQIKKDWKSRWTGFAHIPHLPNAIRYEVSTKADVVDGDVFVDEHKRQGPLGAIIAWGLGDNAPLPGPLEAIATEEPKFHRALTDMLEDLLAGRES